MQITANAIPMRIAAAIRAAITARKAAAESFSVFVPGQGTTGHYATADQAQAAMHHLPHSDRQQAVIFDQDGYCVVR